MNTSRRRRPPIVSTLRHASRPSLSARLVQWLRRLRRGRATTPVRVPTSPRGLEATASRLPTRYRPPRRPPDRRPTRLFIFVSVLIAAVLLLGSIFVVIPQPLPPEPLATSSEALRQPRLPLLAFAGSALLQATEAGLAASVDGGAAWTLFASPSETALTALVVSPQDPEVRYASGLTLGVARSDDGGATWQIVLPGVPSLPEDGGLPLSGHLVTALALDQTDAQHVVAWSAGRGLLTSNDGGTIWQFATGAAGDVPLIALLFHPSDPAILWAGGSQGLYRSQAGSFASVPEAASVGAVAALAATTDGALLVASGRGELWRSEDGRNWEKLGSIAGPAPVTSLVADFSSPTRLWAATEDGRLWRSDDGGQSWASL